MYIRIYAHPGGIHNITLVSDHATLHVVYEHATLHVVYEHATMHVVYEHATLHVISREQYLNKCNSSVLVSPYVY